MSTAEPVAEARSDKIEVGALDERHLASAGHANNKCTNKRT